jgi:hypothetical protein
MRTFRIRAATATAADLCDLIAEQSGDVAYLIEVVGSHPDDE